MDGLLIEVSEESLGSQAVAVAAVGATEVVVEDITDFGDEAGVLDILGVRYAYASVVPAAASLDAAGDLVSVGTIVLAEPLTVAVDEDDPVLVVIGDAVGTEATAVVDIPAGDSGAAPEGGDTVSIPLDYTQRAVFPVGVYDPPLPVVLADDLSSITGVPGARPTIDGGLIDPGTLPDTPPPTDPPEASPVITVEGMPNSLLVKTFDDVAASTLIEYHVSTTPEFTPTTDTLSATTRATVFVLKALPDGASLQVNTTYYVRAVATNAAGAADPSPAVDGMLDPDAVVELALSRLVTGFILTGAIQVGQITIDADEGILIPSADGMIRFPVDGSVSSITADLIATALTMQGTATVQDLMRVVGYVELAGAGVPDPDAAPVIGSTWQDFALTGVPADPDWGPGIATDASGNLVHLDWGGFHRYDPTTGAYIDTISIPDGYIGDGLARVGSYYYTVYVQVVDKTKGRLAMAKYNATTGALVDIYTWDTVTFAAGAYPQVKRTGVDGSNIMLAWQASSTTVRIKTVTATGGNVSDTTYTMPSGWSGLAFVGRGNFLYGAARTVIIPKTGNAGVYSGTTEQTANRFSAGVAIEAATWLTDRFVALIPTADGQGATIRRHARTAAARTVTASYTWYDGNPTGGTHETRPSPSVSASVPAGRWASIEGAPAPSASNPTPGDDEPTIVRIYAGTSSRTLQATLPVGTRSTIIDLPAAGSAEPATNTFSGVPGLEPGKFRSEAADGSGPMIELRGDGTARIGKMTVAGDGTVSLPETEDTGWITFTAGNGSAPFNTSAATVNRCRYRRIGKQVFVQFSRDSNAALDRTGINGNMGNLSLSGAGAIPTALRPDQTITVLGRFMDAPQVAVVTSGGTIEWWGGVGANFPAGTTFAAEFSWVII